MDSFDSLVERIIEIQLIVENNIDFNESNFVISFNKSRGKCQCFIQRFDNYRADTVRCDPDTYGEGVDMYSAIEDLFIDMKTMFIADVEEEVGNIDKQIAELNKKRSYLVDNAVYNLEKE